jgi:HAD superfamily hydrolase (TIGR01549 family)
MMKALVFDLDGTLIDSSYQHIGAWTCAFRTANIDLPVVEIHRRVGMNGSHMLNALNRTFELGLSKDTMTSLELAHRDYYARLSDEVRVIEGAAQLLQALTEIDIGIAIATSARRQEAERFLKQLMPGPDTVVITSETEARSKPDSHQFERAFAKLRVVPHEAAIVGDSSWDMLASRLAGSLGVGVLSGGYSETELSSAGAFRVYRDVGGILLRLEELGIPG